MLLMTEQGATSLSDGFGGCLETAGMSAEAACGFAEGGFPAQPRTGHFDYLFRDAPQLAPDDTTMTARLDALADAMVASGGDGRTNASIAPVFAVFGQFIDHDTTAGSDLGTGLTTVETEVVTPLDQGTVAGGLRNLRFGALTLDSVYGDLPEQGPISRMLQRSIRLADGPDRAKLATGAETAVFDDAHGAEVPRDDGRDLPRLAQLREDSRFDEALLRDLPPVVRAMFFNNDGAGPLIGRRAVIGDARNDADPALARVHLAMIRLHNACVDQAPSWLALQGPEVVFEWARRTTRWIYQWLAINAYLPAVCDPLILEDVQRTGPSVYSAFLSRVGRPAGGRSLPIPLEFTLAASRVVQVMAEEADDQSHGQAATALLRSLMTRQTGNGRDGEPPSGSIRDRSACRIGTRLDRRKEAARRSLRRGYRLSLPTAQACLDHLAERHSLHLARLSAADIGSGPTGAAVAGGFDTATPLWFYLLKEAEVLADGRHLGPLGSLLIADTLTGLVENTPGSYVAAARGGAGWEPRDSVRPDDMEICDMPSMMAAAGLL